MLNASTRLIVAGILSSIATYSPVLAASVADQAAEHASPLPTPEVFSPGVISGAANDGAPTFSPDGNTLFFTRSATRWSIILESHRIQGRWSQPKVASFSGEWSDASPAFSPNGSHLVFVSIRPDTSVIANAASPKGSPRTASHIWRVDRIGDGWSAPVELPATVNCFQYIFRPSIAADGSIYFTAARPGKELSLFRSLYREGVFLAAEALSFSDGSVKDVDPEVAPDQSFLIFSSRRPFAGDATHEHLFIVRNKEGNWSSIEPLRYAGDDANGSSEDNDPRLGPGKHSVYFSSDRTVPVHFPRTRAQAVQDFKRLQEWDNSNSNIWVISLDRS